MKRIVLFFVKRNFILLVSGCAWLVSCFEPLHACTAFQLKAQDGSLIYSRSMEFGFPLDSNLLIVPRKTEFTGTAPESQPGMKWKVKFGYVGMNQSFERTHVSDGMNEQGLVVGLLYLPGLAKYERADAKRTNQTIGPWELGSYLLGTCAHIEDVKAALPKILVAQEPIPGKENFIIPLHYYISDKKGNVLILEYVEGKRNVYDNPLGVLTNAPAFDWHLTNLSNYMNLSPSNIAELSLKDWKIQNLGQGTGMLGLPGDYTPASRFVKAAFFSQWAATGKNAIEAVLLGFHILNTFDIFEGIIQSQAQKNSSAHASENPSDITQWVVVHDHTHLKTYFRNYYGMRLQMVDLQQIDFSQSGLRQIPMQKEFEIEDITSSAKALF